MRKNCVKLRFIKTDENGYVIDELFDVFMGGSLTAIDGIIYHPAGTEYALDLDYADNLASQNALAITKHWVLNSVGEPINDAQGNKIISKISINSVYDIQSLKQDLECKCATLMGELPYNTNLGIPLGVLPQETELSIINLITTTSGVKSCQIVNKQFVNRKLSFEIQIKTIYGDLNLNI